MLKVIYCGIRLWLWLPSTISSSRSMAFFPSSLSSHRLDSRLTRPDPDRPQSANNSPSSLNNRWQQINLERRDTTKKSLFAVIIQSGGGKLKSYVNSIRVVIRKGKRRFISLDQHLERRDLFSLFFLTPTDRNCG